MFQEFYLKFFPRLISHMLNHDNDDYDNDSVYKNINFMLRENGINLLNILIELVNSSST